MCTRCFRLHLLRIRYHRLHENWQWTVVDRIKAYVDRGIVSIVQGCDQYNALLGHTGSDDVHVVAFRV
jgi:hypothetical protein